MNTQNPIISQVWNKGRIISGYPSSVWRYDDCGAVIKWSDYGNRNSKFGWEIDHIMPESRGGRDILPNLRPLQWENNMSKSNGQLVCVRSQRSL